MSKSMTTTASAVLVLSILLVAWFVPIPESFPIVMALLLVFFIMLGIAICKNPLGTLITEQNVMSLSRFQTVLWTIIVISAFLVIAIARIKNGVLPDDDGRELADPLNIVFGRDLLMLLGISAASLVGSPLIAATKKSKTPDETAFTTTARQMVRLDSVPDSVKEGKKVPVAAGQADPAAEPAAKPNTPSVAKVASAIEDHAEGTLYKNPTLSDASLGDMFEGSEVGNAAHVDLSKVQMFFFTMVIGVAYVFALWDVISTNAIYGADFTFPALSGGTVALLGISNAGYLAAKGVDHTTKATP